MRTATKVALPFLPSSLVARLAYSAASGHLVRHALCARVRVYLRHSRILRYSQMSIVASRAHSLNGALVGIRVVSVVALPPLPGAEQRAAFQAL